jgi:hypothetical protein
MVKYFLNFKNERKKKLSDTNIHRGKGKEKTTPKSTFALMHIKTHDTSPVQMKSGEVHKK